jgi:hypothetical protein
MIKQGRSSHLKVGLRPRSPGYVVVPISGLPRSACAGSIERMAARPFTLTNLFGGAIAASPIWGQRTHIAASNVSAAWSRLSRPGSRDHQHREIGRKYPGRLSMSFATRAPKQMPVKVPWEGVA